MSLRTTKSIAFPCEQQIKLSFVVLILRPKWNVFTVVETRDQYTGMLTELGTICFLFHNSHRKSLVKSFFFKKRSSLRQFVECLCFPKMINVPHFEKGSVVA